jgi:hypothetical protein
MMGLPPFSNWSSSGPPDAIDAAVTRPGPCGPVRLTRAGRLRIRMTTTLDRLLGSWGLICWAERKHALCRDAVGQIRYDAAGRMSAQLARRNQARFADEEITADE